MTFCACPFHLTLMVKCRCRTNILIFLSNPAFTYDFSTSFSKYKSLAKPQYGRAGCVMCIPFHHLQYGVYGPAGCIPFYHQQYGPAGCGPCGISTVSRVNMQGVSIYNASSGRAGCSHLQRQQCGLEGMYGVVEAS